MHGMFYGIGDGRYRDHRALRFQADQAHDWERQVVVGSIFVAGGLDGMDFTGDDLAVSPGWSSEPVGESLSQSFAAPKRNAVAVRARNVRGVCCQWHPARDPYVFRQAGSRYSAADWPSCPSFAVA
jgi:hypothetical protein